MVLHLLFSVHFLLCYISTAFIGLLVPATIAFVERPQKYYREYLPQMEALHANNRLKVNESLKGAYIIELETAVNTNFSVFQRKKSMFYNAMVFALLVPFLILFVLGTICPPNATKCKGLLF